MIKRIIAYLIFGCLIVALPLSIAGITRVQLGGPFLAVLKLTNQQLNDFTIAIPSIPQIPKMDKLNGFFQVVNLLITFFNGLINLINFIITIVNYIIKLIEFLVILVKNLIFFRDSLRQAQDTFPYLPL